MVDDMKLTPRPTADEIRAYCESNEVGLYQAKGELHDAWCKTNLTIIKERTRRGDVPAYMAVVALIEVLQTAMSEMENL